MPVQVEEQRHAHRQPILLGQHTFCRRSLPEQGAGQIVVGRLYRVGFFFVDRQFDDQAMDGGDIGKCGSADHGCRIGGSSGAAQAPQPQGQPCEAPRQHQRQQRLLPFFVN